MAANCGKSFLVRVKNDAGTPAFVPLAGLRTKSLSFNREIVDVTSSDSVLQFREILPNCGVRSMSVSGAGVSTDKASAVVIQDAAFDGSLRDCEIVVPGLGLFVGKFAIPTFNHAGEYNGEMKYEMSLESSGDITFTVEP